MTHIVTNRHFFLLLFICLYFLVWYSKFPLWLLSICKFLLVIFSFFYIYWVTSHFVGPDIAFIQCCFEFNKMLSSSLNMNSSYEKKNRHIFYVWSSKQKNELDIVCYPLIRLDHTITWYYSLFFWALNKLIFQIYGNIGTNKIDFDIFWGWALTIIALSPTKSRKCGEREREKKLQD